MKKSETGVLDYKEIGLKAGLEIHQQLASGTKLFCKCPIIKSEQVRRLMGHGMPKESAEFIVANKDVKGNKMPISELIEVCRKMTPVQSELGEDDPAALFEYFRNRSFVYRADPGTSCLVELDESPPLSVNTKALHTALQISRLLNCSLVDEIYFMRKAVIDGSAVSGFQRTGLVATNGFIETSFGRVGVQTLGLEEDSAPALAKGETTEYRLDRLGTPLVEIATDASMHTPQQVKEAAEKIGTMLRSVDIVRGIGSIRQDVNVSIAEGTRVEIKGFQELDKIPELVDNEARRQLFLVELKEELRKRGFGGVNEEAKDVTHLFQHTKCNFVRKAVEEGKRVFGLKVPKFSGLLARQCGDRTFGRELSAYPASHGFGIIHSDEDLEKYSLAMDFAELRRELDADDNDLALIVVGNNPEKAVSSLTNRINYCTVGVPKETRIADGIGSKYARPLPGSGRLYPESDVPAIKVTHGMRNVELPKTLDERREELARLPEDMKDRIVRSTYYKQFDDLKQYGEVLAANLFLNNYRDVSRKGCDVNKLRTEDLHMLLKSVASGDVPQNRITDILIELTSGDNIGKILAKYSMPDDDLRDIVRSAIRDNPGKSESALIGIVIGKSHGKADGKKAAQLIKELK